GRPAPAPWRSRLGHAVARDQAVILSLEVARMVTPILFGVAALLSWSAGVALYVGIQALAGRAVGLAVREVAVGFGPLLFRRTFGTWEFRLAAFPLGGFTRFEDREESRETAPGPDE